MIYAIVGLPLMVGTLASVGNVLAKSFKWLYNSVFCCGCCVRHRKARIRIKPPAIMWKVNKDGKPVGDGPSVLAEDSDSDFEDEDEVNIPLTVSLLVIAISLLCGAAIFVNFEDWPFLDGAYYSFVSLSTIGFGDLVPNFSDENGQVNAGKLVVTWLFLVFGMALVSMCLQMMQDEVGQKIEWLSAKFKAEKEENERKKKEREEMKKKKKKGGDDDDDVDDAGLFDADDENEEEEVEVRPATSSRPKSGIELDPGILRPKSGAPSSAVSMRPTSSRNAVSSIDQRQASAYNNYLQGGK